MGGRLERTEYENPVAFGLTEEDGLFAIGACFVGVLAALLYGGLVWAMWYYGPEVVTTVKEALRSLLS